MRKRVLKKTYSLFYLLSRQPKSIKKNRHYKDMLFHFQSSGVLKKLKISRRCYSLLNRAVIKPENLKNFLRTYKLPKNSFFPLFFAIKLDYLSGREKLKKAREDYIKEKILLFPSNVLNAVKKLKKFEQKYNMRKKNPLCIKYFIPETKKKVNKLFKFTLCQWFGYFNAFIEETKLKYRNIDLKYAKAIAFSSILDVDIDCKKEQLQSCIKKQFRIMSKKYHPDLGGDPELFRLLKQAKEKLLVYMNMQGK